jgi:phosphate transport system protein
MELQIDEMATELMALNQPVARDLRFLTAVLKINNDLERMGDHAVNIAERAISLAAIPPFASPIDTGLIANRVEAMVSKSFQAFSSRDETLARDVLRSDIEVDILRTSLYKQLMSFMENTPATTVQAVELLFVVHSLERIADHATNIAEDVLLFVSGTDIRRHMLFDYV